MVKPNTLQTTNHLTESKTMASKTRRPQTPKPRNEDWMRARLDHSNRNNTVPAGTVYRRPKAGARGRDW